MGFPTPFPEPDSPELQRFAVRSLSEIIGRLRAIQESALPLNIFVDAGAALGVVTLRRVDDVAKELAFTGPAEEDSRRQLPSSGLVTFVGFDDMGKVQFASAPGRVGSGESGLAFTTPVPEKLFFLQRRSTARMRLESAKAAVCRIPVPGRAGEWEALRVLDIGRGGVAMVTYPQRFELVVGARIDDCRLDLPGVGGTAVSLRVRHIGPHLKGQAARCCGCQFVPMTPSIASMVERLVGGLI